MYESIYLDILLSKQSENISSRKGGQCAHPGPLVNRCRTKSHSGKGEVVCTLNFTRSQIFIQATFQPARYSSGKNQEQDLMPCFRDGLMQSKLLHIWTFYTTHVHKVYTPCPFTPIQSNAVQYINVFLFLLEVIVKGGVVLYSNIMRCF